MDSKKLAEYIDQNRWLLNNGLVSDDVKNQLFFCGSIVHKDVQAVELDIEPEKKIVNYRIYVDEILIGKISRYNILSKSTGLIGMWRFKRLLKKEGTLDFQNLLNRFVQDFCGPKWSATVQVIGFNEYVEGLGDASEADGGSQQSDQLSD